ncbi:dynein axonemal assembly factor 4 isoform X2 [Nelusetta ayraudi]|uniref:dynein axonemal assembly factor 4 isoform X2 n=1 Tax=Nelusetta ayraudi TaxID=303726 RepID=UPI003F70386C
MPLLVTDYSWTQTDSMVHVSVPSKGVKVGNLDIVSTDEYLKVHYPPYLFEAFLLEPVDDVRSTAKVGNGVVVISLRKKANKMWEHLVIPTLNKEKKEAIRERALMKYQEKLCSQSKSKAAKKQAEKKYALESMMKLESDERDTIQKMKDTEREKMTEELAAWQQRQKKQIQLKSQEKNLSNAEASVVQQENKDQRNTKAKGKKQPRSLLPPRPSGNIQVTFTPRAFPTALRESRVHEEEQWLIKQAEAKRAMNADVAELKDLKETERNPEWLKDKGNAYFAAGEYHSALNAYNLAIRLNKKIPALYSNRAACHLKLRNIHKATEDSSQALQLLTPAVEANAAARIRAHVRRGSAFCELQLYAEGLQDYQAALKIDPSNEALQADAQRIRDIIEGTTDATAEHEAQ